MPRPATTDSGPSLGVALKRFVDERPLAQQMFGLGAMLALAAAALAWWLAPGTPAAASAAAAGLAAAAGSAAWARRSSSALKTLAESARVLARDDAPDGANVPLDDSCAELAQASQRLHRLVEFAREQRLALLARNAQLGQQLDVRTNELSSLQDLSVGLAGTTDQFELVDEALRALERTLDYASASVWSRDRAAPGQPVVLMAYRSAEADPEDAASQRLRGMRLSRPNLERYEQIEREHEPIVDNQARQSLLSWLWAMVTDDARTSRLYRTTRAWMGLPLKFRDQVMGVLRVDHQEPGYFTAERARLLAAVCSQTALAMRHAQLMTREREVAVAAERNRIARELHDAVSQTLFASNLMAGTLAQAAQRVGGPAGDEAVRQAQALESLNRGALAEMRLLMFELRPDALEQVPLPDLLRQAVEALACRGQTAVECRLADRDPLDAATRVQVWRIAQEALSNVARHSGATQAVVEWSVDGAYRLLRIADDGRGFDTQVPAPGHFGLDNMRSRAADIGARLSVRSAPGEGTEIRLELGEPAA